MGTNGIHRAVAGITLAALLAAFAPGPAVAKRDPAASPGRAVLHGKLTNADGTPAGAVRVVLTPIDAASGAPRSAVSESDGDYRVEGLSYGYYRLGFERGAEALVSNRVLLIPPKKKVEANFTFGPFNDEDAELGLAAGQVVPGIGKPATAVARLEEQLGPSGWAWFRTGKGVAVLIGVSTLVVGGVIALADDSSGTTTAASPSTP